MSAEIKSTVIGAPPLGLTRSLPGFGGEISVRLSGISAPYSRADFLAAVEAECGVTAIDLTGYGVAEMPDGTIRAGKAVAKPDVRAGDLFDIGLCYLALARYRRENPPVDEAKVDALAAALIDADMDGPEGPTPYTVARRLIAAGWSK